MATFSGASPQEASTGDQSDHGMGVLHRQEDNPSYEDDSPSGSQMSSSNSSDTFVPGNDDAFMTIALAKHRTMVSLLRNV